MNERSRVVWNATTNLWIVGLQVVVGLWFTPFLVHNLSMAAYGLVPLALSIANYMSVLTVGIQSSVGRHQTLAVSRGDFAQATRVLSTSLFGIGGLTAVLLPPMLLLAFMVPRVFQVPAGYEKQAIVLFVASVLSYSLVNIREVVGAVAFAHNRLDLQNIARAVEVVLRVAVPVAGFALVATSLYWVGGGLVVGGLVSAILMVIVWRVLDPRVRVSRSAFDRDVLSAVMATGGWVTLNQAGALLLLTTDILVINLVLGPTIGGYYGSLSQWPVFLRSLAGALCMALGPIMISQYATAGGETLTETSVRSVRIMTFVSGLAVAIIVGFGRPLLSIWLAPEYAVLFPVLAMMCIHLSFNLGMVPLFFVHTAMDKVKLPAMWTLVAGALNLFLALALAHVGVNGFGVAIATLIAMTVKNFIFTPIYTARILDVHWSKFYRPAIPGILLGGGLTVVAYLVSGSASPTTWLGLIVPVGTVGLGGLVVGWFAVLHAEDRALAWRVVDSVLHR